MGTVARFSKFIATLPGLIALVVSLNVLHGHVLTWTIVAEAVLTRLLVVLAPANADAPSPVQALEDTGPGSTV